MKRRPRVHARGRLVVSITPRLPADARGSSYFAAEACAPVSAQDADAAPRPGPHAAVRDAATPGLFPAHVQLPRGPHAPVLCAVTRPPWQPAPVRASALEIPSVDSRAPPAPPGVVLHLDGRHFPRFRFCLRAYEHVRAPSCSSRSNLPHVPVAARARA